MIVVDGTDHDALIRGPGIDRRTTSARRRRARLHRWSPDDLRCTVREYRSARTRRRDRDGHAIRHVHVSRHVPRHRPCRRLARCARAVVRRSRYRRVIPDSRPASATSSMRRLCAQHHQDDGHHGPLRARRRHDRQGRPAPSRMADPCSWKSRLAQSSRSSTRSWPIACAGACGEDAVQRGRHDLYAGSAPSPALTLRLPRPVAVPTLVPPSRLPSRSRSRCPCRPQSNRRSRIARVAAGAERGRIAKWRPRRVPFANGAAAAFIVFIALVPLLAFLPPRQAPSVRRACRCSDDGPTAPVARVADAGSCRLLRRATSARAPDRLDVAPAEPTADLPAALRSGTYTWRVDAGFGPIDRNVHRGADCYRHVRRRSSLTALHRARAGTPATTAPAGTSRVTTAPAPTSAPAPMRTPPSTRAPEPMLAPRSTVTR